MMLEEGEIDEEDLKINDYDRVMPSKVEEGGMMEEDGGDDSNHSATKSSSKSSRKVAKGKKRSKRSEKHHHHHHLNDSDSERPSEDKDERIIPAFISPPAPLSTDTSAAKPVSLLDLFKTTSESLLVNPVITEKENKPSSIVAESGSTKRQQTDLKRKVLLADPDESELTVSVEDVEKRFERKRKYAEMFKEKQQQQQKQPPVEKKPFIPTVVCHFFVEGRCQKGDKCTFLHKIEKKLELCKYYMGGYCSKADKCPFMHGEFPCKFFHQGRKCLHGDKCRFSHEPISDPALREAFEKYLNQDETVVQQPATTTVVAKNSLLGSPPHPTFKSSPIDPSLPSLMNLAVKPAALSSQEDVDSRQQPSEALTLTINSELFRDVDERVSALSPPSQPSPPLLTTGGDVDLRAPAPVTTAIVEDTDKSVRESVKAELIQLLAKAVVDPQHASSKQGLTELMMKLISNDESESFTTENLVAVLASLTTAMSPQQPSQPQLVKEEIIANETSSSGLTIDLGRLSSSSIKSSRLKLNSDYSDDEDDIDYDERRFINPPLLHAPIVNEDDLIIQGAIPADEEFPYRLIEIEIRPSSLWSNPPIDPNGDTSDQECSDPRIKYYSNLANCTRVQQFHQQQQLINLANSGNSPSVDTTAMSPTANNTTTVAPVVEKPKSRADPRIADPRLISRNSAATTTTTTSQPSPTRSNSPPPPQQQQQQQQLSQPDLLSIQSKQLNGTSLLSSLPDLQFPKDISRNIISSSSNSSANNSNESSTVKLSIQDYKRKLQRPTSNTSNSISQPSSSQAPVSITPESIINSLPSIPSYSLNLQAPQSLHELLRNLNS